MKSFIVVLLSTIGAVLVVISIATAQSQPDLELMLKWQMAQSVHYDVVAEYAGTTAIMVSDVTSYGEAVRDKFELSFDWNPTEMAMVGKPSFKNFPSMVPSTLSGFKGFNGATCPAPRPIGTFDYAEVTDVKMGLLGSNSLDVTAKRTYMTGQIPYVNENGCGNWATAVAKPQTEKISVLVPLGMWFAMPSAAGQNVTVGKDGKTMVWDDKPHGWKVTYTMTLK